MQEQFHLQGGGSVTLSTRARDVGQVGASHQRCELKADIGKQDKTSVRPFPRNKRLQSNAETASFLQGRVIRPTSLIRIRHLIAIT